MGEGDASEGSCERANEGHPTVEERQRRGRAGERRGEVGEREEHRSDGG